MSQRKSGFARQANDQYMTPEWVALTLFSVMPLYGTLWEPACGSSNINRAARNIAGSALKIIATDIDPGWSCVAMHCDFFDPKIHQELMPEKGPLTIATNPPYGNQGRMAEKFTRTALKLTEPLRGRVAMLLPVDWDAGKTRHDLFEDFPGHLTVLTLTERIRWDNIPQSKSGPSQNHAWFIWDHSRRGRDSRWLGRVLVA